MSPQNCREFVAGVGRTTQATLRLLLLLGATFLSWGGVPPPDCRAEDGPAGESSPLDRLDPARIPPEERFDWQPKELVAVLGSHRGRHWGEVTAAFSRMETGASAGETALCALEWGDLRAATILRGHEGGVFAMYSPDGTTLASATRTGRFCRT
jgi:hypothetical protein